MRFPPGHYYSPFPDTRELAREPRRSQVWPPEPRETPGIEWRPSRQVDLCRDVFSTQPRLDFPAKARSESDYFTENDQYPALDAWVLEAFLRYLWPRRMIEIGSGFSSLVTARVNRDYFDDRLEFVCVEPYPRKFLLDGVPGITDLRIEAVQDTPFAVFEELGKNDILFIDSSHTVKTGGDVPWIYNEVLPRLNPGVCVHIHDIFLPGEYPPDWVLGGWGWNEQYLVQSFLIHNSGFEVELGVRWLLENAPDALLAAFPGLSEHRERAGASLWLRRV